MDGACAFGVFFYVSNGEIEFAFHYSCRYYNVYDSGRAFA